MVTGHQLAVLDRLLERPGEKRDWEFQCIFFSFRKDSTPQKPAQWAPQPSSKTGNRNHFSFMTDHLRLISKTPFMYISRIAEP